jgi:hypothetical protein
MTPQSYDLANISIGLLAQLQLKSGAIFRYQNFSPETITWQGDGKTYEYLPMGEFTPPPRSLEANSQNSTLELPNEKSFRQFIEDNNGLRRSLLNIQLVYLPYVPGDAPQIWRFQLSDDPIQYDGASIRVNMQSPLSITGRGAIPSVHWRTGNGNGNPDLPGLVQVPRSSSGLRLS